MGVELYLNPPKAAVALCVDEKTQVQALDSTQPAFPMPSGTLEHTGRDYVRRGTASLFALDVASGQVIGSFRARHPAEEFLKFVRLVDEQILADLDVHLVLKNVMDDVSTHKTPEVERWLNRRSKSTCASPHQLFPAGPVTR